VRVSPDAHIEIRESLRLWLGYELLPRRQTRRAEAADWIVTWGPPMPNWVYAPGRRD